MGTDPHGREPFADLSRIAVALACKPSFEVLYPTGRVPALGKETIQLLLLLERDDPSQFICFDCGRLCAFDTQNRLGWKSQGHKACLKLPEVDWHCIDRFWIVGKIARVDEERAAREEFAMFMDARDKMASDRLCGSTFGNESASLWEATRLATQHF
ncbi:hypothetical protein ACJZ2D_001299 [Fusarium nematophilum]